MMDERIPQHDETGQLIGWTEVPGPFSGRSCSGRCVGVPLQCGRRRLRRLSRHWLCAVRVGAAPARGAAAPATEGTTTNASRRGEASWLPQTHFWTRFHESSQKFPAIAIFRLVTHARRGRVSSCGTAQRVQADRALTAGSRYEAEALRARAITRAPPRVSHVRRQLAGRHAFSNDDGCSTPASATVIRPRF
jgi:hypothetical protein